MGSTKDRVDARGRGRLATTRRATELEARRERVRRQFVAAQAQRDAATAAMAQALDELEELAGSKDAAAVIAGLTPAEAAALANGVTGGE